MKIFVQAKANAKLEKVEKIDETHFVVSVKKPPQDGKANIAIIKALAKFLGVPLSCVRLVSGASSKQKVFEVE